MATLLDGYIEVHKVNKFKSKTFDKNIEML